MAFYDFPYMRFGSLVFSPCTIAGVASSAVVVDEKKS